MENVYFELTKEFNRDGTIAILTSGQAVVFYRTALMSKDGDWILRETPEACARVLGLLASRGATYRLGAPLDVRWLSGGWSSHLEFRDERGRRVRCDFVSRPPRVNGSALEELLRSGTERGALAVLDLENLIRTKRTQRAKDYPIIGELSRRLPEDREIAYTTDPDRILALSDRVGEGVDRLPVVAARTSGSREDVVVALAREIDRQQEEDRRRLASYEAASSAYIEHLWRSGLLELPVGEAHAGVVELAERWLPPGPGDEPQEGERADADAQ